MTYIKLHKGFSNIELMMVLVVGVAIILMGLRQYQNHIHQKDVATIDSSVKILFTASQKYYFNNCRGFNARQLNIKDDLVTKNFLANAQVILDPFDPANTLQNYIVKFTDVNNTKKWIIEVQFKFPATMNIEKVKSYVAQLDPASINVSTKTVSWTQSVKSSAKSSAAQLSPLTTDMERFSRRQTVKKGYNKFRSTISQDPCD